MKLQFQILMFIFCLNLATGLVFALGLPGTERVAPNPDAKTDVTYNEDYFNATEIAKSWKSTPFLGIPVIGDIFSGFQFLWRILPYLVDGFPMLLTYLGGSTFIGDANARAAFNIIANVLRGIFALMIAIMVIEFISGRYMTE